MTDQPVVYERLDNVYRRLGWEKVFLLQHGKREHDALLGLGRFVVQNDF